MTEFLDVLDISDMEGLKELFFKEVNDDICNDNNDKICCISGEQLEDNHITLLCKHKYNYFSIFNEVNNQKNNSDCNIYSKYLKPSELRCPYCRNVQVGILPYRNEYSKIYGVNYPDSLVMKLDTCKYIFKSGINKDNMCSKPCYEKYCKQHLKIMSSTCTIAKCNKVLKSGKNKGKLCNCNVFKDGYCKRHTV